jgi:hypothetical protein
MEGGQEAAAGGATQPRTSSEDDGRVAQLRAAMVYVKRPQEDDAGQARGGSDKPKNAAARFAKSMLQTTWTAQVGDQHTGARYGVNI